MCRSIFVLALCFLSGPAAAQAPAETVTAKPAVTRAKVQAFLVYMRSASKGAGGAGSVMASTAATAQQGGAPQPKLGGDGLSEMGAAARKGQQDSKLSDDDIAQLTSILSPYYARRSVAVDAVAGLKRYADMPRMAELFRKQIKDGEEARAFFGKTYGDEALKAVDEAEPEYFAIQDAMLKAAAGKRQ